MLDQTTALDHSLLHRHRLQLSGLLLDCWFSDEQYAQLCTRNLAQQECTDLTGPADTTLYLLDAESLRWPSLPRWPGETLDRQIANRQLAAAGLRGAYLHDPRVWQFYDSRRQLGVQLIRRPGATAVWESGGPLRAFLHWSYAQRAYAQQGRRLCHAATLGHQGKGILLVGAGGSGKSGTTLAGIAKDLDTVGDDYCLVEAGEKISAYPLYRILKQDAGGIERAFGKSAVNQFGTLNWQNKFEIHDNDLPRSPFVSRLEVIAIMVPKVAHLSHSSIQSISPGLAMRAFAPSSAFQLPDGEQAAITFAAGLCRQLPCYEMQLSNSASEIAEQLHHFLGSQVL